jgi:catechol 2,3-dioxygenase-like lactoylglutathione lyase family enzyme
MGMHFDRIVLAVPDLPSAIGQYQRFFGVPPLNREPSHSPGAAWWDLRNTMIELVQGEVACPRVRGLVFSAPGAGAHDTPVANTLGVDLRICDGAATASARRANPDSAPCGLSVDHVVLRTCDAQACIDLFAGTLGLRLALDKTAPQWGGRMLFFRAGKLTLEVIASETEQAEGAYFWGLAYACPELQQRVQALAARGVVVSGVREGRKPGTAVATVKSHCLEIPTLLIQPAR